MKGSQKIFTISVSDEKGERIAREIFKKIKPKLPCKTGFITRVIDNK